jgi:Cys-rich protein (TIGR01571 family)
MRAGHRFAQQEGKPAAWEASLCGCSSDPSTCVLSFLLPCVQYGRNAEKIDGSRCCGAGCNYALTCCCCACCLLHTAKRTILRSTYGLDENGCCDCGIVSCCCCCAISQEARELDIRGPVVSRRASPQHQASLASTPAPPHTVMMTTFSSSVTPAIPQAFVLVNGRYVPAHAAEQLIAVPMADAPPPSYSSRLEGER